MMFLLFKKYKQDDVVEHFGTNPPQTVSVERVVVSPQKGQMYSIPGTYQAMLNPRQAGMVDYGANIRYNFPDQSNLAANMGTLNYANMVGQNKENYCGMNKENYCGENKESYCTNGKNCNDGGCSSHMKSSNAKMSANMVSPNFSAGNYKQQMNQLSYTNPTDQLPVRGMGMAANALGTGENVQPIIYDRYIYANQKSFQHGLGDPIRGDLPITPLNQGWFSPASSPQTMLRSGALASMGGLDNDTSKQLMALKTAVSGGGIDTGGGVNYAVQKSAYASMGGGDIKFSAFP